MKLGTPHEKFMRLHEQVLQVKYRPETTELIMELHEEIKMLNAQIEGVRDALKP